MSDTALQKIFNRLSRDLATDRIVQSTTDELRAAFNVDRVVLYYFYYKWSGRVTFESLSDRQFSILGSTGPDGCFNGEYAKLYEEGRVRAIPDIDAEPIAPCHREHLQQLQVKANLVVPIVIERGLWGLLVAHHCRSTYNWSDDEIVQMRSAANKLASVPSIYNS